MSSFQFSELSSQQLNALVLLAVSIGTLYCFLGYRTLKFVLGLTGFLLAGSVAGGIASWVTEGHLPATAIAGLIGGVSGAFAFYFLYKVGVFFLGLLGATLIAHNLLSIRPEEWIPLAVIGLGLAGGVVALLVERPVMTVATAAIGAWMLVSGVASSVLGVERLEDWQPGEAFEEHRALLLVSWSVLAVAGTLAQFATRKRGAPAKSTA